MGTARKLVLGAVTVWPAVFMVLFLAWLPVFFVTNDGGDPAGPSLDFVTGVLIGTMAWTIFLIPFYALHALRSDHVDPKDRTLWVLLIVFGNALSMPVYWWMNIWKPGGEGDGAGSQPASRPTGAAAPLADPPPGRM